MIGKREAIIALGQSYVLFLSTGGFLILFGFLNFPYLGYS